MLVIFFKAFLFLPIHATSTGVELINEQRSFCSLDANETKRSFSLDEIDVIKFISRELVLFSVPEVVLSDPERDLVS